ncbi:hypothetical protein GEV33_005329 [Tenebrio molitor]|uniref:Uncharacterized protein n=1 Tax=Tenebrio molitor TaxID=7067 RepID=A0A8J6LEZ1_TENMO|nr:hypothetical protein GEV33_005329 [Tenebrio molitor]
MTLFGLSPSRETRKNLSIFPVPSSCDYDLTTVLCRLERVSIECVCTCCTKKAERVRGGGVRTTSAARSLTTMARTLNRDSPSSAAIAAAVIPKESTRLELDSRKSRGWTGGRWKKHVETRNNP